VSFVVCFSELDNNLPTVLGIGDEDRLGCFRVRVCVLFVAELDLASDVRDEGGDVGGGGNRASEATARFRPE